MTADVGDISFQDSPTESSPKHSQYGAASNSRSIKNSSSASRGLKSMSRAKSSTEVFGEKLVHRRSINLQDVRREQEIEQRRPSKSLEASEQAERLLERRKSSQTVFYRVDDFEEHVL